MVTGKAEVNVNSVEEKNVSPDVIRKFLMQKFPQAKKRNITNQDNLLESGIIDSLGVLEIVTFLQEEFSLAVEDDELTPENFQNIHSIAQFVEQRRRLQPQPAK
jgi:acyl carrier protein